MPDLLGKGAAWLEGQRRTHLTRSVTYRRGVQQVELPATKGRQVFELTDEQGFATRVETHDWLVTAADLVLIGEPVTPKRGDQVLEQIGTAVFTYEVLEMPGVPPWTWSDELKITRRIHTKLVSTN